MECIKNMVIGSMLLFGIPFVASARNPAIVFPQQTPIELVSTPPQSIYGELIGFPQEFRVIISEPQPFFVQILAPPVDGATIDFSVEILKKNENDTVPAALLSATSAPWSAWNDPWGGDTYRAGPALTIPLSAGEYVLVVSSPDNTGKFVLFTGSEDRPSFMGLVTMIAKLPLVKAYLGVAPRDAFNNRLGAIAAGSVVFFLILAFWIIRKIRRGRTQKLPRMVA
jgi:hypothetical protein